MTKEEVTILTLKNNEKIELPINIDKYLELEKELKANKEQGIYIKSLKRQITFFNIIDIQGKTKHLSLEAPKKEYKEPTPEEKIKHIAFVKEMLEKTYDWRKKRFRERRDKILKSLAQEELKFKLETTLNKLKELESKRLQKKKTYY